MGLVATIKRINRRDTITQSVQSKLSKRRKWMKERLDEIDSILEKPEKK